MFTDYAKILLVAGKGGNGVVAWTRTANIPKGGPCGGDGGHGGSIIIKTSKDIYSLDAYRNTHTIKAPNGACGGQNCRHGKKGLDHIVKVPVGTLIKDAETGHTLYDLTEDGEEILLCKGGKGGYGNDHFKSPTNRAPKKATAGKPGRSLEVEFELKLIADVGFVGLPNAGKSTLLSTLTPNQVKIGDYPFTTLKPNLSFIKFDDFSRIYLADIPGIIKDAHEGRGLGLAFLKHIERTSTLVYVLDSSNTPYDDFLLLQTELKEHDPKLLTKPFIVALNKADLPESKEVIEEFTKKYPYDTSTLFAISAKEALYLAPFIEKMRALAQVNGKKFK